MRENRGWQNRKMFALIGIPASFFRRSVQVYPNMFIYLYMAPAAHDRQFHTHLEKPHRGK